MLGCFDIKVVGGIDSKVQSNKQQATSLASNKQHALSSQLPTPGPAKLFLAVTCHIGYYLCHSSLLRFSSMIADENSVYVKRAFASTIS